jgi:uncharacterized membrane protein YhhN
MINPLFWAAVVFQLQDWVATGFNWKLVRYITKPATLLILILWFVQIGGLEGRLLWFGLGLVFSLAGDIFLMLPSRFFIGGLIAFLLGMFFISSDLILPRCLSNGAPCWHWLQYWGLVSLLFEVQPEACAASQDRNNSSYRPKSTDW